MLRPLRALLVTLVLLGSPVVGRAQDATPVIELEDGVTYGEADGRPLQLDVFRPPARDEPRPAVVLLPGWGATRFGMDSQARELAEAGYVAVAVDYTLKWPEFIDDAQLAVRWVRANADRYGIDPERICAYGHSSGGQLAAMLAVRDTRDTTDPELAEYSSRVACAVDLAGTTDATIPHPDQYENEVRAEELGGTLEEVPDAYRDVSPVAFVDEHSAPMLVIQGADDFTNPVEQSRLLVAALQEAGVEVAYVELAGEGHGIDYWDVNGPFTLAFLDAAPAPRTLRRHGRTPEPGSAAVEAAAASTAHPRSACPRSPGMLGPPKPRRLDQPIAVSLEDLVPPDHFYRHLEAKLDLSFVRDWTRELLRRPRSALHRPGRLLQAAAGHVLRGDPLRAQADRDRQPQPGPSLVSGLRPR